MTALNVSIELNFCNISIVRFLKRQRTVCTAFIKVKNHEVEIFGRCDLAKLGGDG